MLTVYSDDHRLQHGRAELTDGALVPCFEKPERADLVRARIEAVALGPVRAPRRHGRAPLERVHDPAYLDFLEGAWADWTAEHGDVDALPLNWPVRHFADRVPDHIDGRLGYYGFDAGTPITAGTWAAASAAADVALTAAGALDAGARVAFALTRPPGHHAARDLFGGYCFLNNAAIAAAELRARGAARVAVLDIDYHHGNGTQAIFWDRADVFFASIHADPAQEFPYFLGYADEVGAGQGAGATLNLPLPWGTGFGVWRTALATALRAVGDHGVEALVVSLGVDTYKDDPISRFRLDSADYPVIGADIAALGLPSLFVLEGGYATQAIGVNAVGVLQGFEGA